MLDDVESFEEAVEEVFDLIRLMEAHELGCYVILLFLLLCIVIWSDDEAAVNDTYFSDDAYQQALDVCC